MDADVLIVGSGFGGTFAADALVKAGAKVVVVERGPWRHTAPLAHLEGVPRRPLPSGRHALTHLVREVHARWLPKAGLRLHRHGLFDLHVQGAMSVLCSSGVGGGSHVYSAMNTRPARADYWDANADGVNATDMSPHYDHALQIMGARPPRHGEGLPNFSGDRLAEHPVLAAPRELSQPPMGYRFEQAAHDNNSYFGCRRGDKVTLDARLLVPHLGSGLQVLAEHEVVDLGTAIGGWRLSVRSPSGEYRHLRAPKLIMAAGTLNTLRLMMAARERGNLGALPGLGLGFSGNGDAVAWWRSQTPDADFSKGAPCHGRFVFRHRPTPGYLTLFGVNGIQGLPLPPSWRHKLSRDQIVVGMGEDGANGMADWAGRLRLSYSRAANPILQDIARAFRDLAQDTGQAVWHVPRWPMTVHPCGGARLSRDERTGVVNACGEVHAHPGLYVTDASALPASPGTPPSMSVAAWALHVGGHIAQGG